MFKKNKHVLYSFRYIPLPPLVLNNVNHTGSEEGGRIPSRSLLVR